VLIVCLAAYRGVDLTLLGNQVGGEADALLGDDAGLDDRLVLHQREVGLGARIVRGVDRHALDPQHLAADRHGQRHVLGDDVLVHLHLLVGASTSAVVAATTAQIAARATSSASAGRPSPRLPSGLCSSSMGAAFRGPTDDETNREAILTAEQHPQVPRRTAETTGDRAGRTDVTMNPDASVISARTARVRPVDVRRQLDAARQRYWEDPTGSLATAVHCQELGRRLGEASLRTGALALQGAITLHRGDLRGAFALATEADLMAEDGIDDVAGTELAALKAHLSFFSGSYTDALRHADRTVALAERSGDIELRIFAGRSSCLVLGNIGVADWPERLNHLLELTLEAGNRWEEAISRNDLACLSQIKGDVAEAEAEIERGLAVARQLGPANQFAIGVLHSTRADIRLAADRPEEALADAEQAIAHFTDGAEPNPYVLGVTVRAQVQALMTLGRLDDAQRTGEGALSQLGDRVPRARSLILHTLATALRECGRIDDAYDALARSAELERQAFDELSEMQMGLERATLETTAARRDADAFAEKNSQLEAVVRQLAEAHTELERRTEQLELLQEQLREQADRDWLTGLHNRRFLARELDRLTGEGLAGPFSVAVIDLDHFKSINDRFGHDIGDRVLMRVATILLGSLRASDVVVRTGGEEFAVLMPFADAVAGAACGERLCRAIREERWERIAPGITVTASIGMASVEGTVHLEELAKLADRRLYAAKAAGRDRVVTGSGGPGGD
jgi:diguanylate cyclase (GGDEF)-like protein